MSMVGLLLESTIRASLVMLAALAMVACLRRRSAAVRHWILSAAVVAATAMPALSVLTPSWHLPLDRIPRPRLALVTPPAARPSALPAAPADRPRSAERATPAAVGPAIATTWLAGTVVSLLILFLGMGRLAWVASSARRVAGGRWAALADEIANEYRLRRPVVLLQSDHPALLVTWGFVRPKVILPRAAESWTEARIRVVLSHELAHIKRGDWLIQLVAEITRASYWFNPVIWIACRRLRLESEQATDDVVLHAGIDGSEYAAHLLDLARTLVRQRPWIPAPAIARPSSLERRVNAMLNTHVDRAPVSRRTRLGIVAGLSAVAIAVASAQGTFSKFSGTVFDPLNGFLPGVTMTLTDTQSGAKHEIRSDRSGHFEFVGLPPGSYALQAVLPGFSLLTGTLDLTGRDVQRDVTLKVASLQETISVWGRRQGADAPASPAAPIKRRPAPDKFAEMKACSAAAPVAGSMGGNLRAPTKVVDVKPLYPAQLADAGTGGIFEFAARIGTGGTIVDLETLSGSNPDLELAAANAIRQWEFTPTLLNCIAVEVPMKISVTFKPVQ